MDSNLIRYNEGVCRADIVGLKSGLYDVLITRNAGKQITVTNALAYLNDRSGYAHFNNSTAVGAYNNDGTLKPNAVVVYVSNETKNTVSATLGGKTYTGLVNILKNQSKSSYPLDIRILDKITTNQWKSKDMEPRLADGSNYTDALDKEFFNNELETTYGENLVGLSVKLLDKKALKSYNYTTTKTGLSSVSIGNSGKKETTYSGTKYSKITGKTVYDDDSYNNMLDISGASNVTVEGIGNSAEFFQFGMTWSNCNSIEVRNLTITSNPEDACSFDGDKTDASKCGNYWIHNNVFNKGLNKWDITGERDKNYGDGAFDLSGVHNVTLAYNKFNNCKKTGLVGGSDTVYNMNITFHHNYYNQVGSRLPLGRQANMHLYNNYYYKCSTAQDIRANAFVLSEGNYFEGCTNPQKVTKTDKYKYTVIKSYNDYLTGCGKSLASVVSTRNTTLSGLCLPNGKADYTNFDINSSLFYYDSINNKSNVELLTSPAQAKNYCIKMAGIYYNGYSGISNTLDDNPSGSTSSSSSSTGSGSTSGGTEECTTYVLNAATLTSLSSAMGTNGFFSYMASLKPQAVALENNILKLNNSVNKDSSNNITDHYISFKASGSIRVTIKAKINSTEKIAVLGVTNGNKSNEQTANMTNEYQSYTFEFSSTEEANYQIYRSSGGTGIYIESIVVDIL